VAGTCECGVNLRVSYNAGNFLTSSEPVSFSKRTQLHGVNKLVSSEILMRSVFC
jgi:hypothetical protein